MQSLVVEKVKGLMHLFLSGCFWGTQSVLKQLQEQKDKAALVKAFMLPTKTAGKGKGRPKSKGAKKGTPGGSQGKGKGKNPKSKPKSGAKKPVAAFGQKEEDKTADSTQSQEVCKFDTYILLIVQNPELKQKSFFEGSTLWIRFGN